jgi:hypothetical protein
MRKNVCQTRLAAMGRGARGRTVADPDQPESREGRVGYRCTVLPSSTLRHRSEHFYITAYTAPDTTSSTMSNGITVVWVPGAVRS